MPEKRVRFRPAEILKNVFFVFVVFLIIQLMLSFGEGPTPLLIVSGRSMERTLLEGDVILWYPTDIEEVREGEIIVFIGINGNYVVHRVVSKISINGKSGLLTKGDNNDYIDQEKGELLVTEANFVGKVVTLDRSPFRIPYIGILWIEFSKIKKDVANVIWGRCSKIEDATIYFIIGIFLISTSHIMGGRRKEDILRYLFKGAEKIRIGRIFFTFFAVILILTYVPILILSTEIEVKVGVNESIEEEGYGDINFSDVSWNSTLNSTYYVYNPCMLPIKTVIFVDHSLRKFISTDKSYLLHPRTGLNKEIVVFVPYRTTPGIYSGKIRVFSSFFWTILPEELISFLRDIFKEEPLLVLTLLNLISSVIFSTIYLLLILLIDKIVVLCVIGKYEARFASVTGRKVCGYVPWLFKRFFNRLRSVYFLFTNWLLECEDEVVRISRLWPFLLGGFVYTIVCIRNGLILPIIYGSVVTSAVTFIYVTRSKAEIFAGNFVFVSVPITVFFVKSVFLTEAYVLSITVFSFLYLLLMCLTLPLSYITIRSIIHLKKLII